METKERILQERALRKKYRSMTLCEYLEFIDSRIKYAKRDLLKLTRKIELYDKKRSDIINKMNKIN